jgi:nucleoid-associated protein YgaU
MPGTLNKLKMYAYSDEAMSELVDTYTVQINPETYKHSHASSYDKVKSTETAGQSTEFTVLVPQTIAFEFYLDATGLIPGVSNLITEIKRFKSLVYEYNGQVHSPNYLKLVWAGPPFKCRLTSLDIDYTLFMPNGVPLRAKINVGFEQFRTPAEIAQYAKKNSPDMTHVRTVQAGDTLPLMCFRIYGDSNYYIQIARFNGLRDFRKLKVGSALQFPPVERA